MPHAMTSALSLTILGILLPGCTGNLGAADESGDPIDATATTGAGPGSPTGGGGADGSGGGGGGEAPEPPAPLTFYTSCAGGGPLVHAAFQDHMVLQRDAMAPVWGCAAPGTTVAVDVAGQTQTGVADATGLWSVRLAPMAAGGPYTLAVSAGDAETLTLQDVLVGDVWFCSGQSNMQWTVSGVPNAADEVATAASLTRLRLYNIPSSLGAPEPQSTFADPDHQARWSLSDPGQAMGFSAVCFFTGRELARTLDVPIGLISLPLGGTVAEAWVSARALATMPDFQADLDAIAAGTLPPDRVAYPTSLFNGNIAPLIPFGIKGVLWYQGESNAGRGEQYQRLLPLLVQDWRSQWGRGDFPFLLVEIANYSPAQTDPAGQSDVAGVREAQFLTTRRLPAVGMSGSIDLGNEDIHPTNKQDVAERLALTARGLVYRHDVVYEGPSYRGMAIEGGKIRLSFDHVHGGLMVGLKQPLTPVVELPGAPIPSFAVAGADGVFAFADAVIEGDTVVVSSPSVPAPTTVHYAWANNPRQPMLYNRNGLPTVPFRTEGPVP